MNSLGVKGRPQQTFFGREDELEELQRLVDAGQRLLTVVAPGGYGKSRLVREFLARAADGFRQGACEVLLAPVGDPGRIPRLAAESLGLRTGGDKAVLDQLKDYLRDKELLLHFDNFEHLLSGAPLLPELLAGAPELVIIATSREPLGIEGEHVLHLGPLPVEMNGKGPRLRKRATPAASLFASRAVEVLPGFTIDDQTGSQVDLICRTLEGVPLAIELAAAWVDRFSLPELQRELHQQLDLIARAEDVPERHRSVRASCDWSYRLLNEEEQLVLRCAAVFKGGFEAAEARRILPLSDIETVLAALAAKSWLYTSPGGGRRYYMHDAAIREYTFQRLLASDDYELAVRAHCEIFRDLLSREAQHLHSGRQLEAVRAIRLELENIYEALDTALRRDVPALVLPFARHLFEYQVLVGAATDCVAHYGALTEYSRQRRLKEAGLYCSLALGMAQMQLGEYNRARKEGLAAWRAAGMRNDTAWQGRADVLLGEISRLEGKHDKARFHFERSLTALRSVDGGAGAAEALHGLGRVALVESDYVLARELIGESLKLRRGLGDKSGIAACLNDLGTMEYREGDLDQAYELQLESLAIQRGLGDQAGIGRSLNSLGNVEFSRCDYPATWTLYSESLAIRTEIGDRYGIAACLNNLGNVQYCEGNFHDARRLLQEALRIKREIGDRIGCSYSLNNTGNTSIRLGELKRAAMELREALEIAADLHSIECMVAPLANSANLLARAGRMKSALLLYYGTFELQRKAGLAFDPMDGGMVEEAFKLASAERKPDELETFRLKAERMSRAGIVELALRELAECELGA